MRLCFIAEKQLQFVKGIAKYTEHSWQTQGRHPMWLIDQIVEEKVRQAQADGTFTDLPGQGKPLVLDDDSMIPESLRVGYRILKNHGVIPEEIQWRQEIKTLEDLLRRVEVTGLPTDPDHELARKRLHLLQIQVGLEHRGYR